MKEENWQSPYLISKLKEIVWSRFLRKVLTTITYKRPWQTSWDPTKTSSPLDSRQVCEEAEWAILRRARAWRRVERSTETSLKIVEKEPWSSSSSDPSTTKAAHTYCLVHTQKVWVLADLAEKLSFAQHAAFATRAGLEHLQRNLPGAVFPPRRASVHFTRPREIIQTMKRSYVEFSLTSNFCQTVFENLLKISSHMTNMVSMD